jgi:hypothetical protein
MSTSRLADDGILLAQIGQKIAHAVVDNGGKDNDTKTVLLYENLLKDIAMLILGKAKIVMIEVIKILRLVKSAIEIPAVTEPFVVADHFQVNIGDNVTKPWQKGEVRICKIGDDFKEHFFGQGVSVRDGQVLSCNRLIKNSYDMEMLKELGSGIETDLAGLWYLLEQQPEGGRGFLCTDGYAANIFYITDNTGVVQAVRAHCIVNSWYVDSHDPNNIGKKWDVGVRVFSRNSGNQPL